MRERGKLVLSFAFRCAFVCYFSNLFMEVFERDRARMGVLGGKREAQVSERARERAARERERERGRTTVLSPKDKRAQTSNAEKASAERNSLFPPSLAHFSLLFSANWSFLGLSLASEARAGIGKNEAEQRARQGEDWRKKCREKKKKTATF